MEIKDIELRELHREPEKYDQKEIFVRTCCACRWSTPSTTCRWGAWSTHANALVATLAALEFLLLALKFFIFFASYGFPKNILSVLIIT